MPGIDLRSLRHVLKLTLTPPKILQRYHIEIWAEKTTMNDVLLPLCQRYGVNLITGAGEQSLTSVCVSWSGLGERRTPGPHLVHQRF